MVAGIAKHPLQKTPPHKTTLTEIVCQKLEANILNGFYKPGEHLDETALATHLGCSRTPVREALSRLVALGLLVRRVHCGVYVVEHNLSEMVEAYVEVESLCTSLAISRMTTEVRKGFMQKDHDPESLQGEIRMGCGNPVISELANGLKARIDPYLRFEGGDSRDRDRLAAKALAAAVAEGDQVRASNIIRCRMQTMIDTVRPQLG